MNKRKSNAKATARLVDSIRQSSSVKTGVLTTMRFTLQVWSKRTFLSYDFVV